MTDTDLLRGAAFAMLLALLMVAERCWPYRGDAVYAVRQLHNVALVLIGTLMARLLLPLSAVAAAQFAAHSGYGLFQWWTLPWWLSTVASLVLLDLAIYVQHRLFHVLPWMWRLHRVHHSDERFDVSLGVRFHPLELLLSLLFKVAVVSALGAPVLAVVLFELLLSASALYTHADTTLPSAVDRRLRAVLVTPDMHRIHHSQQRIETDSNYGSVLSVWDRCFGSYRDTAASNPRTMALGIAGQNQPRGLLGLLLMPFRRT